LLTSLFVDVLEVFVDVLEVFVGALVIFVDALDRRSPQLLVYQNVLAVRLNFVDISGIHTTLLDSGNSVTDGNNSYLLSINL
jgi:hypothetical protein